MVVVAAAVFFWLGSKKKQNQPTTKAKSWNHQNGEEKMRKEKSGARTLGLWERAIKDHERVREGKKKEESFWAIISILYAPLRQHLTMGSDRNEKRGANFHHRWDWDGERELFFSSAFSWTMIDFHVCAQLAEKKKKSAGSAAAADIYAYMQENCNNNYKRAPYKSNGVVVQV